MMYFLDTNIIIYSIKNSYPGIQNHFLRIPSQKISIPSIVTAEIEYGAKKSFDYDKTIQIYRQFMIASIVLTEEGVLVTHNVKEFSKVPNLRLEDWTE